MKNIVIVLLVTLIALSACKKRIHFITDKDYRETVEQKFQEKQKVAEARYGDLFDVFDSDITKKEKEALEFLYAYMPLSDMVDYNGEFFLKNVKASFEAKESFDWGKNMPEEIFRHFVLPHRINNENLDTAKIVFLNELKERLQGMSMKEAALEVNHWCHEKVNYHSADIRTSAPLATYRTSYGRCGEESTFTVTALRSVCIPARQVYTPRWAHCNDNHAWVEVWVDGNWHFLGACEPDVDLDMGWFLEPARRAMLVHTKVYGDYLGPEEIIHTNSQFTEINVIKRYAKTKKIIVKVKDKENNPVDGAEVDFLLFNYSEFFPLATKTTDTNGETFFTTGLGDMLVWATKNNDYGFDKLDVRTTDTIEITIDKFTEKSVNFDMFPPEALDHLNVKTEGAEENTKRLKQEDSIRTEYISTFIYEAKAHELAEKLSFNKDSVWSVLDRSEGNWRDIKEFIEEVSEIGNPLEFLFAVLDKDLRDTPKDIFKDHFIHSRKYRKSTATLTNKEFETYVASPRINNEILNHYNFYFNEFFEDDFKKIIKTDVKNLVNWINSNIKIDNSANRYAVPITPRGVMSLNVTDVYSRDIFFVAICRIFGIPARIEPASRVSQYMKDGKWNDAVFDDSDIKKVSLSLINENLELTFEPQYFNHFTVAKFNDGRFTTYEYEFNSGINSYNNEFKIDAGQYLIVTGNRLENGKILIQLKTVDISDENNQVGVYVRDEKEAIKILGNISKDLTFNNINGEDKISVSDVVGEKGAIIAWVDPNKEPTKHMMNDFRAHKQKFEEWGGGILLIIPDEKLTSSFKTDNYNNIPSQHRFVIDKEKTLRDVIGSLKQEIKHEYPVVFVVTNTGDIIYNSAGYNIELGDQMLKNTGKIQAP
jgi:hypothetical protein